MKPGDKVRATFEVTVITGTLTYVSSGYVRIMPDAALPLATRDLALGTAPGEWQVEVIEREPYQIPDGERYFLDADGYCWREVDMRPPGAPHAQIMHSMARVNPDNSPTPTPYTHLVPVEQVIADVYEAPPGTFRGHDARWEFAAALARKYGVAQ